MALCLILVPEFQNWLTTSGQYDQPQLANTHEKESLKTIEKWLFTFYLDKRNRL